MHVALALGLAACQNGHRVRFTTAAALVSELIEARDEKHLRRFQKQLAAYELHIVDEGECIIQSVFLGNALSIPPCIGAEGVAEKVQIFNLLTECWLVAGHENGGAFVALTEDLEEQLGASLR